MRAPVDITAQADPQPDGVAPEARLLLLCSRSRLDAQAVAAVRRLLATDLDWQLILRLAQANGVSAMLYWQINALQPAGVPEDVLRHLRDWFFRNAARNLLSQRELLTILSQLESAGVSAIPFKGPLLAAAAYTNGALREYVDLDILVQHRDLRRALQILHARGYRRAMKLQGFGRVAYLQSECAIDLVNADGTVMVEVHWDLMPYYFSLPFELNRVWCDTEQAQLDGHAVLSLSITDLLLFLCLHGAKHRWEQLRWLCDIAELVRARPDLDWQQLIQRATEMGSERMLLLGLLLAADLLEAPVPAAVLAQAAHDTTICTLARSVVQRLFSESEDLFAERNLFYLRAMQSPWQRLRYCLHVALVPTKSELQHATLPAQLSILLYPLHVLRILGQAVGEVRARQR
ncbi:MAG: nucleotidyltransferase family protein [Chloroflexota bacterium]